MKSKLLILLVLLLLISGCTVESSEFSEYMSDVIADSISRPAVEYQNNHKTLYSYYLPVNMGKSDSNNVSTVLVVSGYDVIMNLNVENILTERYYGTSSNSVGSLLNSALIYQKSGSYLDYEGNSYTYNVFINELENNTTFILFKTNHFTFLANVSYQDVGSVMQQLFTVARSTRINEEEIVTAYSRKEVLNYENQIVEIFQVKAPIEGDLMTLLENSNQDYDWNIDELDYLEQNHNNNEDDQIVDWSEEE